LDIGKAMEEGGMCWLSGGCEIRHTIPGRNIFARVRSASMFET